ncbi:MAG: TRAP transporter small permease [Proteobacteria bacterium]|nr:TRAP transporter small permease [Pseudomonadota bacterium]
MLSRIVNRLEEGLIALLLAVMTVITFVQVVARYVFNWSFVWALELVTFLFAWLIFLGASYGVRVGAHIGVDALVKVLAPGPRKLVASLAAILCMVYATILFVGSWQYVDKMYAIGILAQDLPIPQWVPRIVLPLGFGLLFFRFGTILAGILAGRESGLHLADEAAEALTHRLHIEDAPAEGKEGRGP